MVILRFGSKSYGFQLANILYDGGRSVGKFCGLADVDGKSLPWFLWIFFTNFLPLKFTFRHIDDYVNKISFNRK